jgi:hypothetical protein
MPKRRDFATNRGGYAVSAASIRECEEIAARARSLLHLTRAKVVRALPGVEAERAQLLAIARRADKLAAELRSQRARGPLVALLPPAARPREDAR